MKAIIEKYLPIMPLAVFFVMAIWLINMWISAGWVHYDSQYRILPKESYKAAVITADDYAKLQDRSLLEVKLSNGTVIADRQPSFYSHVLPNYKKVGDHYICVTTIGTAHFFGRLFGDTLPLMLGAVIGLFVSKWDLRRRFQKAEDKKQ